MDTKTPRQKLTVRVWDRLFNLLVTRTDECCQRRDALLEQVLSNEIDQLRSDLPLPNSQAARAHIEYHLKVLFAGGKKQMSLALTQETAAKLEAVCQEKNVPRESFLNRLILLLVAKPGFIDQALFNLDSETAHIMRMEIKNAYGLNLELENGFAPLPMVSSILADPFWGYRAMAEKRSDDDGEHYTLYGLTFLMDNLMGLNCYVPDNQVPGTDAFLASQQAVSHLLAELGGDEVLGETEPDTSIK
jgi:hypothetical protein